MDHDTFTEYDYALGVPTVVTDTNGARTSATYDGFGRMLTVCYPGEDCTNTPNIELLYDDTAAVFHTEAVQKIDVTTVITVAKYYNGLGQLLQTQQQGIEVNGEVTNVLVDYDYDALGRPVSQSTPYTVTTLSGYYTGAVPDETRYTETTYDLLGRTIMVTATNGVTQTYVYNDLLTWVTDGEDNTTLTTMDARGRTVQVTPPLGPDVFYQYNEADQLTRVVKGSSLSDPDKIETILAYDYSGRKIWIDDPDMGQWSYVYDALGNLEEQTDARGCTTTISYDILGRVTGKTYDGPGACAGTPSVTYTYDQGLYGIGRRTGMSDGSGTTTWSYDLRGRTISETRTITGTGTFTTQWGGFNSANQPGWMFYPGGEQVDYDYNAGGALSGIEGQAVYAQGMEYDAAGRLTELVRGSNITTAYGYYAWNQEGGRLETLTTGSLQSLTYDYDDVGNILSITDILSGTTQTQAFTYDALNRLSTAQASGGIGGNYDQETYEYDEQGRIETMPGLGGYSYEDPFHVHAVTHISDIQKYWYDPNGNMTYRVTPDGSYELDYDADNRLIMVSEGNSPPQSSIANAPWFDYDWDYRQVVTTTHSGELLYQSDVLIELNTSALISAGKLQSDCDDLRITDQNGITILPHWIEGGCNSPNTQIWTQVPWIPDGSKNLYLYYGNENATNSEVAWSGDFILISQSSCPTGWTEATDLEGRFPRGAASYGATGGASQHDHGYVITTSGPPNQTYNLKDGERGLYQNSNHVHANLRVDINTTTDILPPYQSVVYCKSDDLVIPNDFLALYNKATLPSEWTRVSDFDGRFPFGSMVYGTNGGAITHTHQTTGGYNTGTPNTTVAVHATLPNYTAPAGHYHRTSNGETEAAEHLPPYLDILFAEKSISSSTPAGIIVITSQKPPLGWDRFSDLDGYFPRGSEQYGQTGGSLEHSHNLTITTGTALGNFLDVVSGSTRSAGSRWHTHSATVTTENRSNLPPYIDVIFSQRKDPSVSSIVGDEQQPPDGQTPTPPPAQESWYDTDWDYRKSVTAGYSGSTLTDYDVLIEIDTASLVTAGKMQSDCDDLRVTDSDMTTPLSYWIEGGCNTGSTQVWARVPSMPDGGKSLYVYYGNPTASSAEASWSGSFVMMTSGSCPGGWTRLSSLDGLFARGAASYGGTGGSSSHSHAQASCTTGGGSGSTSIGTGSGQVLIDPAHTHTDARVDIDAASDLLPPYLEVVYCQSPDLAIDSGLIGMFDDSAPSG